MNTEVNEKRSSKIKTLDMLVLLGTGTVITPVVDKNAPQHFYTIVRDSSGCIGLLSTDFNVHEPGARLKVNKPWDEQFHIMEKHTENRDIVTAGMELVRLPAGTRIRMLDINREEETWMLINVQTNRKVLSLVSYTALTIGDLFYADRDWRVQFYVVMKNNYSEDDS